MRSYKVGTYCLATEQGLGYLAKDFYDNGLIDVVAVHPHSSRKNHYEWYPDRVQEEGLFECDTVLFFETPFNWKLIPKLRERGIKTVFMPMYECTGVLQYQPDVVISPSLLDQQYYPDSVFIPVPVDVPWRLRETAKVFVHNAGNGGLGGRNGTKELIEAMKYVVSPIKLIIRSQVPIQDIDDPRIEVRVGTFDDIWSEGDVFVFPEKFNGLSLPLQEAFASGMAVVAGDRFPINNWLPKENLITVDSYKKERIAVEFDSAVIRPEDIASAIDKIYNTDITEFSLAGKAFATSHSWKALKEAYETVLSPSSEVVVS